MIKDTVQVYGTGREEKTINVYLCHHYNYAYGGCYAAVDHNDDT